MLEKIEQELLKGRNIFLTGAGGTGKSYILKELLKKYPANFVVTSSTGISAMGLHEGARTIHSFSTIGTKKNEDYPTPKCLELIHINMSEGEVNAILNTTKLIIEEISMISASQLNLVDRVFRYVRRKNKPFGGIQVIFSGDFLQLPPVSKKDEEDSEFAFKARSWKEAKPVTIYLNEVKRTDNKEFAEILLRLRTVDYNASDFKILKSLETKELKNKPVLLFASNKRADEENKKVLDSINKPLLTFKGKYRGPRDMFRDIREGLLCPHELQLKEGCRVMITANERRYDNGDDKPLEYVNGSLGTFIEHYVDYTNKEFWQIERDEETGEIVLGYDGKPKKFLDNIAFDVLKIKLDTGSILHLKRMNWNIGEKVYNKELDREEFEIEYKQFPVRLAHGITIHKSQGLSLDTVEIDCEGIFTDSQFYVAISRARSMEGLKLRNFKGKYIRASTEALDFYKNL